MVRLIDLKGRAMLKNILILALTLTSLTALADAEPLVSCALENAAKDPSNQRMNVYEMDNGQVITIWRSFDYIKTGTYEGGAQDIVDAYNNQKTLVFQKSAKNPSEAMSITFGAKYTRVVFPDGGKTDLICKLK